MWLVVGPDAGKEAIVSNRLHQTTGSLKEHNEKFYENVSLLFHTQTVTFWNRLSGLLSHI